MICSNVIASVIINYTCKLQCVHVCTMQIDIFRLKITYGSK